MADAKTKPGVLAIGGWLIARPTSASAWLVNPLTALAYGALIILVVGGVAFGAPLFFLYGLGPILPVLAFFERVRIDEQGATAIKYWFVVPTRRKRFGKGGFYVWHGFADNDVMVVHSGDVDADDGIESRKPEQLMSWLNSQVERLQPGTMLQRNDAPEPSAK